MPGQFKLTAEQAAIVEAFLDGGDLVLEAGAGSGKTSTLRELAKAAPAKTFLYLAFNRSVADEAARSFPSHVTCKTSHALAYRAVSGMRDGKRLLGRLKGPRQPAETIARRLGIDTPVRIGASEDDEGRLLRPEQIARLAMATVARFCRSADFEVAAYHVPTLAGLDSPDEIAAVRRLVLPYAQQAWADVASPDGRLPFDHGVYLKLWQLSKPVLPFDVILYDEAQDANPVTADVVERQTQAQRVMVGDQNQAIYGWNGSIDAMRKFAGRRLRLSQSFRFGPAVADEANKWLTLLGTDMRIRGFEQVASTVGELDRPDAILCRTNGTAVAEVIAAQTAGRRVALVGGGWEIRKLAEAAITLRAGQGCDHPELMAFRTWAEVQAWVEDEESEAGTLKTFVKLIDSYGPETVIAAIGRLVEERVADLIVSTAHKAKGREWDRVRIADDFVEPKREEGKPAQVGREDAMLAYVSVTRAKLRLDPGGLAWVDGWLTGGTGETGGGGLAETLAEATLPVPAPTAPAPMPTPVPTPSGPRPVDDTDEVAAALAVLGRVLDRHPSLRSVPAGDLKVALAAAGALPSPAPRASQASATG